MSFKEEWVLGPLDTKFYTRRYETKDVAVAHAIFLHGMLDHSSHYEKFLTRFPERGISILAFDQRGWGKTALDLESKSPNSSYGVTNFGSQMEDIDFFVQRERNSIPAGVPIFLIGQSMGGAEALEFVTLSTPKEHSKHLRGIIASSPLIAQGKWILKLMTWAGKAMLAINSSAGDNVIQCRIDANALSHDPEANQAYGADPLVLRTATLRAVMDGAIQGELLLTNYKNWPQHFPVLLFHGTGDWGQYHGLPFEPAVNNKYFEECVPWITERSQLS